MSVSKRDSRNTVSLETIITWLGEQVLFVTGDRDREVTRPAPIDAAPDSSTMTFCSRPSGPAEKLIADSKAGVVLCNAEIDRSLALVLEKTLIGVAKPRLAFLRVVNEFFRRTRSSGVHPTAAVDAKARLHPTVSIGAFCFVGACEIGEGTEIGSHVHIGDGTKIGRNVQVFPGAVLGADGFGYERNENGEFEKFPHIGGVVIGDDVEVGANTCIDRGTLGNTIVEAGSKIDNLVHIAHNVVVGERSAVIAHAMVGGSTRIGAGSWIAPCASIRDGLTIGKGVTVGLGAVVVKDVADGETVMGAPAQAADDYKLLLRRLRALTSPT